MFVSTCGSKAEFPNRSSLVRTSRGSRALLFRAVAVCVVVALLVSLSSCIRLAYETREFDSLEDLKVELGSAFLYPAALPAGLVPDKSTFIGFRYFDSDTWEYSIRFENTAYATDEDRYAIEPGGIRLYAVNVRCYEPVHEAPARSADYVNSSRYQIERFEGMLVGISPNSFLDIEEVQAFYRLSNGLTSGERSYWYMNVYVSFMSDGILYDVGISYFAHPDEDPEEFRSHGKDLAEAFILAMLYA